jgi:hypothetical protein
MNNSFNRAEVNLLAKVVHSSLLNVILHDQPQIKM